MKKLCDLLIIAQKGMGNGDPALSLELLGKYFNILIRDNRQPAFIAFYNEGVKIVAENSEFTGQLQTLQERGVKMIVCSTCLDHYGIDNIVAGHKGTMPDIITLQSDATKVLTL
ncbi:MULTISPECIES: DsrE family protein [unclassified Carboxylicivirga]|uniref:DsrE family protein n=1 Tax=Carboxylicivirga TaxID=1628153 RepID=UPI003D34E526